MRDDRAYFYERAEAEIGMAQKAASAQAVRAHYHLASHYLDRAYSDASGEPATSEQVRSHLAADLFMLHTS